MDEAERLRADFYLAEYREAANAYFKGVDIGYTGVKGYVTINSLFAALIVGLSESKGPALTFSAGDIIRPIPAIALVVFVCLLMILPHYFKHLNSCRDRCKEIEALWGGRLFTHLKDISSTKLKVGAGVGGLLIFCSIGSVWIYLAYRLQTLGYIFGR